MNLFNTVNFKGGYNASATYNFNDSVDYAGSTYLSTLQGSVGNTPSSSPYWVPLTSYTLTGTPAAPLRIEQVNGPVDLSPSGGSVVIGSLTLPQGVWHVEVLIKDLTISLAGFGSTGVASPMVYLGEGKYEGVLVSLSPSTPSGINISTVQGPGYSKEIKFVATQIVTP